MAEVHVIGQILDAEEFSDTSLFCKWLMKVGKCNSCIATI